MFKMVDPYKSRVERVSCTNGMKKKYKKSRRDSHKIINNNQVEGFKPGKIFQSARGPVQNINQSSGQVIVV